MEKALCIKEHSLYLVLSEEYGNGRSVIDIAMQAVAGGIDILQMREKYKLRRELIALGMKLSELCKQNKVIFIINDDPLLAAKLDADGVHMGQEDMLKWTIEEARQIIGRKKIIGVSTHSMEQFRQANGLDVDYIAFGPIFPTKTKNYSIGMDNMKEVLLTAVKPVVFIGGINLANLDTVLTEGAKNIALIRDVMQAPDIKERVKLYKSKLMER